MKDPDHKGPLDVLGSIYENMYEDSADAFQKAENKTESTLHKIIDEAGELMSDAQELSREQVDEISEYVKRDISDAAHYLSDTGKELSDWLGFELELLESKVVERLLGAVDSSTLSLLKLKEYAQKPIEFHTGQVTGPGVLECDECGNQLHYYKAGRIPPCAKCHKTNFHRVMK